MHEKIASMLDSVSDALEAKGFIKEAAELDAIANMVEVLSEEENSKKTLIIMRGLPGSGKSTKAKKLHAEQGGELFSTDDYPGLYSEGEDGKIEWHGGEKDKDGKSMIAGAHEWNQSRAFKAMESGVSPIIVDNTHVQKWEAKPYVLEAKKNGYNIAVEEADTPWKFDVKELSGKNTHGVSVGVLEGMLSKWEEDFDAESIIKSKAPWEKEASSNISVFKNIMAASEELLDLGVSLENNIKYEKLNARSMSSDDRKDHVREQSELEREIAVKKKQIEVLLRLI